MKAAKFGVEDGFKEDVRGALGGMLSQENWILCSLVDSCTHSLLTAESVKSHHATLHLAIAIIAAW